MVPDIVLPNELALRRQLLSQLLAFILVELAFIVLIIVCLVHEIPCSVFQSSTLNKAMFTFVFIAWQTFAITCARGLVLHAIGSEWHHRLRQTGKLIPGHTDLVSITTSGFRNQLRYFLDSSSSPSFRISYVASWLLVALAGIAPVAINVDDVLRFRQSNILITNFTATGGDVDGILNDPIIGAGFVAELELRENATFGFATQEHVILGWPNVVAGQMEGDMQFETDALLYNMSCWWQAPSFNMSQWNTTWYAGGFAWYPWTTPDPGTVFEGGLMPMYRFSTDQDFNPDNFPLPLPGVDPLGLSGYLFFGRNSSFSGLPSQKQTFNLGNIPTIFSETGFHFLDFDSADGHFESPLASFLLCDPQARILDGHALLSQMNASLSLQSATLPVAEGPKIGNISPDAANVVLGLSLLDTLETDNDTARIRVGILASRVFLNDTSLDFDNETSTDRFDIGILPTEEIQRNLNQFMQSGSKALSSYTHQFDDQPSNATFLMPVKGAIQRDAQVLTGSLGFVITTICLVVIISLLIFYNIRLLKIWQTPVLNLESLLWVLKDQAIQIEKVDKHSHLLHHISDPIFTGPSIRQLSCCLIGFAFLEMIFFFLVFVCSTQPVVIQVPLTTAEVKGSFTMIFILWHASAILLLSGAASFAFSSEWSLQHSTTGLLVPGETDRVSVLISGNMDKAHYFFTGKSTSMFRAAFVVTMALTALNSFAPGTLSIGLVKMKRSKPLKRQN